MRTQSDLEELFRINPGKFVMLAPRVFLADGTKHPNCGQVGKVTSVHGDKAIVELKVDGDKSRFLLLPTEVWIVLLDADVNIHNAPNGYWYELSDQGKRVVEQLARGDP